MSVTKNAIWLEDVKSTLPEFLYQLRDEDNPFHFYPANTNLTNIGKQIQLGFSCLALRTFYILDLWQKLPDNEQHDWIQYINSFQVEDNGSYRGLMKNGFIDPIMLQELNKKDTLQHRLKNNLKVMLDLSGIRPSKWTSKLDITQLTISAETKQALAILSQINASPHYPYMSHPQTAQEVENFLKKFNWNYPWAAGAHYATLCLYTETQTKPNSTDETYHSARTVLENHINSLANQETGGYHRRDHTPEHGELINGAMKVFTGLEWIQIPVHYPEKLIDTCLSQLPSSEGCHVADAVYVLFRCLEYTDYRRQDIENYLYEVLEMIRAHFIESEGGFSYHVGKSQTHYYSARITYGENVADLHGTSLLVWTLSLIMNMLEDSPSWHLIKP